MSEIVGAVNVEEHRASDTTWIAIRARGSEWSWLTRDDALSLARHLIAKYEALPGTGLGVAGG